ncbi:MAG: hypothetical protein GWN67_22545 [Phycisphaerae bacterium]|nr:hypothetical protein [Phycisphaerae bacterium]NIU59059.1 hypothetical protein [Phycisphaerae bacterium]NIW80089.1 hypothetical protein [Calditrichia bacterium]NIW95369.1 hypothetical protein [Phycisphaerae bacterium]
MYDNIIPNQLINDFHNEKVILFVGSGMSCNANLPAWKELIERITNQLLNLNNEDLLFFNTLDSAQKVEYIYDQSNKISVTDFISDQFLRSASSSDAHKLLVTLPVRYIITTNWDNLIEDYFYSELKSNLNVIWKDEQLPSRVYKNTLIKIHGTISEPNSIIFSENEYLNFLYSDSLLKQYVSILIATSTLLFIGYSYSDINFKVLYGYVKKRTKDLNKKPYIFLPNADPPVVNHFRNRGLEPIVYRQDNNKKATIEFMKALSEKVSITATNSTGRLKIIHRENTEMLQKAKDIIIRNQANLGPLATPVKPSNTRIFGDDETSLEAKCANTWRELIEKGACAKCIICIDKPGIFQRYEKEAVLERLTTLKHNIESFGSKIEIVNIGVPFRTNLDIYGTHVCIESIKVGHKVKSYNKLLVYREESKVKSMIDDFDRTFSEIKKDNMKLARHSYPNCSMDDEALLKKWIIDQIEACINDKR